MKPYENVYSLDKKVSYEGKNRPSKISLINLQLINNIFDTINISLLIFIFILSFLSFNSQRNWSITYEMLSRIKAYNSNLIDYISKTEELYISEIESRNSFKKTTPQDLIYLEKIKEKKENYFNKTIKNLISGIHDSKYERGF